MKFYDINNDELNYYPIEIYEAEDGEWATRADAEQAAKDAVEMAKRIQKDIRETFEHDDMVGWEELPDWKDAQAIIERYEGVENGSQ